MLIGRRWGRWATSGAPVLATILALAALPATRASAASSSVSESGYWVSFVSADQRSVLAERADGSGLTKVVSLDGGYISSPPVWPPNGALLALSAQGTSAQQPPRVVAQEVATGSLRTLASGTSPGWSPDSTRVAYVSPDGSLSVVGADGTRSRMIDGPQPGTASTTRQCPVWSPNGLYVAALVSSYPKNAYPNSSRTLSIRVVRSDGSGVIGQITDVGPSCPTWSPDSQQIAFARTKQYSAVLSDSELMVTRMDGSGVHELTGSSYCDGDSTPLWSHDGARILFERLVPSDPSSAQPYAPRCPHQNAGLWTVTPDGTKQVQLLAHPGSLPTSQAIPTSWSSDDQLISFVDEVPTNCDGCDSTYVAVLHADGSGPHRLGTPSDGQPNSAWPMIAPLGTRLSGVAQTGGTAGSNTGPGVVGSSPGQAGPGVGALGVPGSGLATPGVAAPGESAPTTTSSLVPFTTTMSGSPERSAALPRTQQKHSKTPSWGLLALFLTVVLLGAAVTTWRVWNGRRTGLDTT